MESSLKVLHYFADPMCSWCWGFTPVIDAIKTGFGAELKIGLILGGLRPGTRDPISDKQRDEILHHWRAVNTHTGQPFNYDGAMPAGFIYNTEPASRAVISMGEIDPAQVLPYFKAVQSAFYVGQQDVTQEEILITIAERFDIDLAVFKDVFRSERAMSQTQAHFRKTQAFGVQGFPTVILQNEAGYTPLNNGYRAFEDLREKIDGWLKSAVA